MPSYIMLFSLNPDGRRKMLANPDIMLVAQQSISIPDTQVLGLYAVLGEYDFVGIVEAPDNESAARFSMEMGANVDVQVTTLPTIPIGRFEWTLMQGDFPSDAADADMPDTRENSNGGSVTTSTQERSSEGSG